MTDRFERQESKRGQSLVETALALPVILFIIIGIFEFGRLVFIYSELNNASREAARYGASVGAVGLGVPRYLDCAGIRQRALETSIVSGLETDDIQIAYDTPDSGAMVEFAKCGDAGLVAENVQRDDRIVVTVSREIKPILLAFLPEFSPTFVTARTILKDILVGPPECSDGADNDGDGDVDYPADSGCSSLDDTVEAICYRLSVVASPAEAGTMSLNPGTNCANRYIQGTLVNLEAFSAPRYVFDHWTGITGGIETSNPAVAAMDQDRDVTAHFRLLTAELGITKSSSLSEVDTEAPFSYQIAVSNAYSDTASNVTITDTLPLGINYTGYSGPGSCTELVTDRVIVCTLPELAAGDTANFTLDVDAPTVAYTRFISNSVRVSAQAYDPDDLNNSATASTRVLAVADLAVEKSDSADPVNAKENFVYGVAVRNDGPSVATGVVLTDKLPAGMVYLSSSGCALVSYDSNTREIRCELDDIAAGTFVNVNFTVTAPANGGDVVNSVNVSSNEDPDLSNNSDTENTTILGHSKLILQKWSYDPVYRDDAFEYHITVTNDGPSDAQNVIVTDRLPSGVEYLDSYNPYDSTPPDPGNPDRCLLSSNNVICELETVPAGEQRHITIMVIPRVTGAIENTAAVDSTTRLTGDNEVTSTVDVQVKVGLSLSKTATPDAVFVGDSITYTIKATNSGPSDATNVYIVDRLPDGVQYTGSLVLNGWSCDASDLPLLTCSPDDDDRTLYAGSEVEITIYVTAVVAGTQTNTATLYAAEISSGLINSTDTKVNPPLTPFDLSLEITAPRRVASGSTYTYYLYVSNGGGYVAPDVVLESTIPVIGALKSVQVTDAANSWTCSVVAGASQNDPEVVSCTATEMAPNTVAEIAISVLAPFVPTIVTNEGEVSSSEPPVDSDPTNNAQFADTIVE